MLTATVHAMATGADSGAAGNQGAFQLLFPMVVVILIFYFLIIRPQQSERKRHQAMLDNLKTGDKVITNGGMLGTIHSISDQEVQIKVCDKVKISFLRSGIRGLSDDAKETNS